MIFVSDEMLNALKSVQRTLISAMEYVDDLTDSQEQGFGFMYGSIEASARDLNWMIGMMEADRDERK